MNPDLICMIIFTGKDTAGVKRIPVSRRTGTMWFVTGIITKTAMAGGMPMAIEDKLVLLRLEPVCYRQDPDDESGFFAGKRQRLTRNRCMAESHSSRINMQI